MNQRVRYVCYLGRGAPTNAAASHVGTGYGRAAAEADAHYWPNQHPWVRTDPYSRAPAWARREADWREAIEPIVGCVLCGSRAASGIRRGDADAWLCPACRAGRR